MIYSYSQFLPAPKSTFATRAFQNLEENIQQADFPCYYAKRILPKNSLYVSFIEQYTDREDMFRQAMADFAVYAELERTPDVYRVFVLSIDIDSCSWDEDNALMWDFMRYLRAHDTEAVIEGMPDSPEDKRWSFSFMGMPWFFNLNSPNLTHRRSRNVTGVLSFILQRTDSFDKLLSDELDEDETESKRKIIRAEIRGRVGKYDGQPASPLLAGEAQNTGLIEWLQFHLPNHNSDAPQSKCPFHN